MQNIKNCFQSLKKDYFALSSFCLLITICLIAILAPLITPFDPLQINLDEINQAPSIEHLLGTDHQGRDILSRIIYGSRYSLSISLLATCLSLSIGISLGLLAGYTGGIIDKAIVMIIDITMAFPALLLAIGISIILKPGVTSVIIALSLVGWTSFSRLTRGMVISLKETDFIKASQALGCSPFRIILKHLLPNCLPIIITATSLKIGSIILSEAALSFLGLGIQPPLPTWGSMINLGRDYIKIQPWSTIAPGLAIAITIVSFNLLGEFIEKYLNPKKVNP